jgi:hypothetical protein
MKPLGVRDPSYDPNTVNPASIREQSMESKPSNTTNPTNPDVDVGMISKIADSFAHGKVANTISNIAHSFAHGSVAHTFEQQASKVAEKGKDPTSAVPETVGQIAQSFEKGKVKQQP